MAMRVFRRWASDATQFKFAKEFSLHKLTKGPNMETTATKEEVLAYFKEMAVIRRMETLASEAYRLQQIRGFLHLYSGQEAVAVGMKAALDANDSVISAYRCHGWAYVMGWSPKNILAELFGKAIGCSEGKGGSMHMYTKKFFGGNGIVGAQVPVGAGIALAHKYKGEPNVCVALYGDGASNQGQVFEAFNIAQLWKLPTIFVCENNKYGMGTSAERSSANTQYYTRGDYIPGIKVDGMDVLAVREATKFAKEHALSTGPIVLEMETYRYNGHSMSDPDDTYRTRDDIKRVRETYDPILQLHNRIVEAGFATEDELAAIQKEVRKTLQKEHDEALAAPQPTEDKLYAHILTGEKITGVRGCDILTTYSQ